MPNCKGSTDGKHYLTKCAPKAVSFYCNYKSFHSVNFSGVFDANCCFTLINEGTHGCESNSSVFSNSTFGKAFSSGDLNVLPIINIPGTSVSIPLYFVEDETFPQKS
jgi:hypothetical protein